MIKNKTQFINKIKENKDKILIKRSYNLDKNSKIKENSLAKITHVQSNSIKIKYNNFDRELWLYFNNYEIKDNKMYLYNYIPNYAEKEVIEKKQNLDIDIIPVEKTDKINKNNKSNFYYSYKYVILINEIIEI